MENHKSYRFNYRRLDQFLNHSYPPQEIGNQLDDIMNDLVYLASKQDDFGTPLRNHHHLLRELRDIFWKLEKL